MRDGVRIGGVRIGVGSIRELPADSGTGPDSNTDTDTVAYAARAADSGTDPGTGSHVTASHITASSHVCHAGRATCRTAPAPAGRPAAPSREGA
ncbi:hypothetical protein [Streptomyces sp. NPDC005407]|uniref:hypothetical protein n=1 Tax=Streptomyces sp. NPDC005407 TaxID=3155340 RepID=UPI0033A600C6